MTKPERRRSKEARNPNTQSKTAMLLRTGTVRGPAMAVSCAPFALSAFFAVEDCSTLDFIRHSSFGFHQRFALASIRWSN